MFPPEIIDEFDKWVNDEYGWNMFAREYLRINLDKEQDEALYSIRHNNRVAISSGTSRGKDYLMAVAAICFLYLTPEWDEEGSMVANTKVVLTAPTSRQVKEIMTPEISRIFRNAPYLPGWLTGNDIRTPYKEWFLTGFKADDLKTEAWTGFHAVNIMFGITEATGMHAKIFDAIEGNLQGNSRLVLVFNPNINHGYAASAMKSPGFKKIRLNSLNAPNVVAKKIIHPGQVDYNWVKDKIIDWCMPIQQNEYSIIEQDFEFEGSMYRPNDLFRAKVLGHFPKVSEGVLVPGEWIELANDRWKKFDPTAIIPKKPLRLGADIAGMGRDSSCFCFRFGNRVTEFETMQGGGTMNHMEVAGNIKMKLKKNLDTYHGLIPQAFIDTIGEGAGVYSRLDEQKKELGNDWIHVHSCKFSEAATDEGGFPRKDFTGQYQFLNMRAWSYWAIRDWLNPANKSEAMLPPDDYLFQELTETRWKFRSDGKIQIEDKEELKKRIKRSPDKSDALANTFWPIADVDPRPKAPKKNIGQFFH